MESSREVKALNEYYRTQYLDSSRSEKEGDYTMSFTVKEGTDLLEFAKAAKAVWESVGDYPHSFTGFVRLEKGNAFATFNYLGALEAHARISA